MDPQTLQVGIAGATGFVGAELRRLVLQHPKMQLKTLAAGRRADMATVDALPAVQPGRGPAQLVAASREAFADCDVAFLALPHAASAALAVELLDAGLTVFDLSADFRLKDPAAYAQWYGEHPHPDKLAWAHYAQIESFGAAPAGTRLYAIPGCYPTATALALGPALRAGLLAEAPLSVQGFSGVSGAGRNVKESLHFCAIAEGFRPYGPAGTHRHTPEMEQSLSAIAGRPVALSFQPHLLPFSRGLAVTAVGSASAVLKEAAQPETLLETTYAKAYEAAPLVSVSEALPDTRWVVGSARAVVSVRFDARTGLLHAYAVIDNLLKGAAAQAIQACNLHHGLDELCGLPLEGPWP